LDFFTAEKRLTHKVGDVTCEVEIYCSTLFSQYNSIKASATVKQ